MATRPNRAAGVTLPSAIKEIGVRATNETHTPSKGRGTFKISKLSGGTGRQPVTTWHFALPPAVEAALQFSPGASVKGSMTVPEAKPGMLTNSSMKYKNFLIPGGTPVIQAIGIQASTIQLVGTFIGTEGNTAVPSLNPIYPIDQNTLGYSEENNSASKAVKFDREIVQAMQRVYVEIQTDVTYKYEGVIMNFKYYMRNATRTYYVMDLLATTYK